MYNVYIYILHDVHACFVSSHQFCTGTRRSIRSLRRQKLQPPPSPSADREQRAQRAQWAQGAQPAVGAPGAAPLGGVLKECAMTQPKWNMFDRVVAKLKVFQHLQHRLWFSSNSWCNMAWPWTSVIFSVLFVCEIMFGLRTYLTRIKTNQGILTTGTG